jgi:3-hydroxyacyl-CoA dehydrogenase/enoyl-CoA hydratase/3-hydroxybutyryl-CoA epimerase
MQNPMENSTSGTSQSSSVSPYPLHQGKSFTLQALSAVGPLAKVFAVVFDLPGEKVNKFSREVIGEFEVLIQVLEGLGQRGEAHAVILSSGKKGQFIAGADIEMIRGAKDEEEAFNLSRHGQKLLDRWEDLPFPTVAAIAGPAMGGGCELSLASSAIVMSEDPGAKIGLPEVLLGIIPGMGGCVRMSRKLGLATSLDLILTGKTLNGKRAMAAGLVEAVVPKENFEANVQAWVLKNLAGLQGGERLAKEPKLGGAGGMVGSILEKTPVGRAVILKKAREGVNSKTRGNYPAPLEAIQVLADIGASYGPKLRGTDRNRAMEREARGFARMAATEVSKNLIRLFFMTEAVKKSKGVEGSSVGSYRVARAGVLGAGVMGGGIAQLYADKGIQARMKDITPEALGAGLQAASKIFKSQLKKRRITPRQAQQKMNLIAPSLDYSGFGGAEFVVEAVIEKMDIKKRVLAELERFVPGDAVIASNTSSLSITEMQSALQNPERFGGMHFFNPVAKMPLIEVIRGQKTSDETVSKIYQFSKQLGKTPIVVKDAPGFLVNRLLMPYLNEATWLLADGATIEEIDEAMLEFGMPMGPMELIDEVGVDVGEKVAHILFEAFGARMTPAPFNTKIVKAGRLGKKNGKGIYVYEEGGRKKVLDPEIYSVLGVTPSKGKISKSEIIERCILPMINEASRCLEESVVATSEEVDLGMIMGTGFPPFRGGLLRYADTLGPKHLVERLRAYQQRFQDRYEPSTAMLLRVERSQTFYS